MRPSPFLALLPLSACLHSTPDLSDTLDTDTLTSHTSSGGNERTTTTGDDTSTTTPLPCDDDPACGPDENVDTCPSQCSVCGDGLVSGDEACDRGPDNQTYWPTKPPADACSQTCTITVEWCGDANINGNEPCDNGSNTDPDYSMTMPPAGACASGCLLPGHCGDATINGPEFCDQAAQTPTCELSCVAPTCGDGIHNPFVGEACDDANTNDGDGCSADCNSFERLVFATSATYFGDLNKIDNNPDMLSGLALADARCQQLAAAVNLPGAYRAWLSTATESPSTRFDTRFTGLYRLTSDDAPIVATGWEGLANTLLHPIDSDEAGHPVKGNVWTNTLPDGNSASDLDCSAWTVNDDTKSGFGKASTTDATWTNADVTQCSNALRLYCFQDA